MMMSSLWFWNWQHSHTYCSRLQFLYHVVTNSCHRMICTLIIIPKYCYCIFFTSAKFCMIEFLIRIIRIFRRIDNSEHNFFTFSNKLFHRPDSGCLWLFMKTYERNIFLSHMLPWSQNLWPFKIFLCEICIVFGFWSFPRRSQTQGNLMSARVFIHVLHLSALHIPNPFQNPFY